MKPNVSIFIKTYPADYGWLPRCLESIQRFARDFSECVILSPSEIALPPWTPEAPRLINCIRGDHEPGYLWQQATKISADIWALGDFIMYLDSDCVLTREFSALELFHEGRPKLLRRPWSEAGSAQVWREPTDETLGTLTAYETMCCHPMIYRRSTLENFRASLRNLHRRDPDSYILTRERFSEFNAVGNFILQNEAGQYHVLDCGPEDGYPRPVHQDWSHNRELMLQTQPTR